MGDSSIRIDVREMLEHTSWVRGLARKLAGDAAQAADLEQATWVAALKSKRREGVPLRDWLGSIVRNFARQERRGAARREEHETRAAREEALPSVGEVVERAELQRKLVDAVMQLAEPYRTAILLRYFDNLPPRAIAARTKLPVATVRTHIARGLEKLRARFDREHGGRGAWLVAFAPLWKHPVPVTASVLGGTLAMNTKLVLAAAAIAVTGAGWWFVARDVGSAKPEVSAAATHSDRRAAPSSSAGSGGESTSTDEQRNAVDSAQRLASNATAKAAPEPSKLAVRGLVLDSRGESAGQVKLVARSSEGKESTVTSNARGEFELADAPEKGTIVSGDPTLTTVLRAGFQASTSAAHEAVVVVAPRLTLAGRVVDEQGNTLEGADVRVELPADFRSRFHVVLDQSASLDWHMASETDGSFELDGVPQVEGARLMVELDGFDKLSQAEPEASNLNLSIVLARPRATDGVVRGKVVDPSGAAVEGARVAFGVDCTTSDDQGAFAFRIDDPQSFSARVKLAPKALIAVQKGYLPARFTPPIVEEKPAWPSFVTLRLDGAPLALEGRVVDAKGAPMPAAIVWIADATLLGAGERGVLHIESLLAGDERNTWHRIEAADDGTFEIEGLLDRDYVVCAMDPETLLRGETKPTRAGTRDVEVRLPTDQLYARVAGTVVSQSHKPIAGVRIYPMCDAFQARLEGQVISTSHNALDGVVTDDKGHFEIPNVPKSLVYLRVDGDTILPLEYGRYVEGDSRFENVSIRELPRDKIEQLEIVVEQRCHMQVELSDASLADELAVLDGDGHELVISLYNGQGRSEHQRHPIHEGRSDVLAVPDTGRTLVLFKTGAEATRLPVALKPGELTTVRP